jgi:hypothetical protein
LQSRQPVPYCERRALSTWRFGYDSIAVIKRKLFSHHPTAIRHSVISTRIPANAPVKFTCFYLHKFVSSLTCFRHHSEQFIAEIFSCRHLVLSVRDILSLDISLLV